jgi:hypothetical protein
MIVEKLKQTQFPVEEMYNPNKSWLTQYDARDWFMKYGRINELLDKYGFSVIDVKGEFYLYSPNRGIKLTFDTCYLSLTKQIMEEQEGTHKLGVVYLSRNIVVDNELTEGFKGRITIPLILKGTLTQEEFFLFIENAMKELDCSRFSFR